MAADHSGKFLVDENGRFWQSQSTDLQRRLNTLRVGDDLTRFVVRNLGYAYVENLSGRPTSISYVSSAVSLVTLTTLMQWVYDQSERRYVFYVDGNPSAPTLVPSRLQAGQLISQAIDEAAATTAFWRHPIGIDQSPFHRLWPVADSLLKSELPDAVRTRLFEDLFGGSFTLARRNGPTKPFELTSVGSKIVMRQCPRFFVGQTFRDMHDVNYGSWIGETVEELDRDIEPMTEVVAAPIKLVGWSRPRVCRYSRLFLGARSGDTQVLLTASLE